MSEILIEQVSSLSSKLKVVSSKKSEGNEIEFLEARSKQVASVKDDAASYIRLIKAINDLEDCEVEISIDFSEWASQYQKFRQNLAETGDEIQSLDANVVSQFFRTSSIFFKSVENSLKEYWSQVCDVIFTAPSIEGLDVLGQIPSNVAHIKQIKLKLEEFESLKANLPVNFSETVANLRAISNSVNEASEKLDTSGLDPSIRKFLRAIKTQSCTLADVDETVLEWLRQKQSSKKYRVNLQPW